MNRFLNIVCLFLLTSGLALSTTPPSTGNKYVQCDVSVNSKKLKAGASGEILISLKPVKGIHINLTPPISLLIDSSSTLHSLDSIRIPKKEKYLDVTKQIRQSFTLAAGLKPGALSIRGTLVYYYCSDAEGWCSKFKQPIDLALTIVK